MEKCLEETLSNPFSYSSIPQIDNTLTVGFGLKTKKNAVQLFPHRFLIQNKVLKQK